MSVASREIRLPASSALLTPILIALLALVPPYAMAQGDGPDSSNQAGNGSFDNIYDRLPNANMGSVAGPNPAQTPGYAQSQAPSSYQSEPQFQAPPPVYSLPPNYPVYGAAGGPPSYRTQTPYYPQQGGWRAHYFGNSPYTGVQPYAASEPGNYYGAPAPANGGDAYAQPQPMGAAVVPQGTMLTVTLGTSISTQVAKEGDYVQATINQNLPAGNFFCIPGGSVVQGEVTNSLPGRHFSRSGLLALRFDSLRLPNGQTFPIQAHVVGSIAKYSDKNGEYRGEGWGSKVGGFLWRAGLGAAGGAALGTAVGAIAGGGHGAGMGAWSGTAIGGGIGLLDDLVLRKGKNVLIHAGTQMQIELDQPLVLNAPGPYREQAGGAI